VQIVGYPAGDLLHRPAKGRLCTPAVSYRPEVVIPHVIRPCVLGAKWLSRLEAQPRQGYIIAYMRPGNDDKNKRRKGLAKTTREMPKVYLIVMRSQEMLLLEYKI
jgi:hypothetical protein